MEPLLTLDTSMVALYLLITLAVGLARGRGTTTMKQYVLGDHKRCTTGALIATLLATLVGGATTIGQAEKIL